MKRKANGDDDEDEVKRWFWENQLAEGSAMSLGVERTSREEAVACEYGKSSVLVFCSRRRLTPDECSSTLKAWGSPAAMREENVYRLRLPEHTIWLGGSYKLSILKEVGFSFSRVDWSHCGHDAEEIKEAAESMALEWWTEDVGVVVLFKMCSASDIGSLAEKYGSLTVLEGEIILSGAGGVDFSTIGNDRL